VEVKSASEVKDYYIDDCAVQAWVLEVSGVLLKTVEVAVVNTSFVYPGGRDYHGLFRYQDATERVRALTNQVPKWAEECRDVLEGDVPPIVVGDQCANPYPCPFVGHCTPPGPEYPVTCLPNGRDLPKQLQAEGIFDIRDIPEGRLRKPDHERVRRVTVSGKAEVGAAVGALLRRIPYPRYYLDFETIQFAVPIWPGTRPYQQIPFQWSCHIEDGPGKLDHTWFLDTSGEPPMRAVAESLLNNLGQSGPIFMYSSYEKRIIRELAELYPDLASGLNALIERLVDLWLIVKRHYYHPSMKGSWSLKPVAAAISPEMSHANLDEVTDGQAAQRAYWEIIQTGTDQGRRDDLRRKLLDYCKLDTMAMVSITRFLEQVG
jgi:hypothetical protein